MREIIENANFEAQARNCSVQLVQSIPSTVLGNAELLHRAIENVIRNAVIYTYEGTTVDVRLRQASYEGVSYVEVMVRDHGPGVPEPELPHLFRPFYRVSNARERQTGGTGLGLAITKLAISLHNGSVTASNARDGWIGSTNSVTNPSIMNCPSSGALLPAFLSSAPIP
jgi:two-component system sensor histidine kinase CpxA